MIPGQDMPSGLSWIVETFITVFTVHVGQEVPSLVGLAVVVDDMVRMVAELPHYLVADELYRMEFVLVAVVVG